MKKKIVLLLAKLKENFQLFVHMQLKLSKMANVTPKQILISA